MLTLERAAELVATLLEAKQKDAAIDLFCHFDDVFRLSEKDLMGGRYITQFAMLCGYPVATNVRLLEDI